MWSLDWGLFRNNICFTFHMPYMAPLQFSHLISPSALHSLMSVTHLPSQSLELGKSMFCLRITALAFPFLLIFFQIFAWLLPPFRWEKSLPFLSTSAKLVSLQLHLPLFSSWFWSWSCNMHLFVFVFLIVSPHFESEEKCALFINQNTLSGWNSLGILVCNFDNSLIYI